TPVQLQPVVVRPSLTLAPVKREAWMKTAEEQVADAERARQLREQAPEDVEPAPSQPAAADEQHRREEAARDRARHEAVKKQLAAMSVQGARRDVVIKMYSTSWCGVCTRARDYMHEKNIPFSEYDVEQDDIARGEAHALNPKGSVPTISIDGDAMIGF